MDWNHVWVWLFNIEFITTTREGKTYSLGSKITTVSPKGLTQLVHAPYTCSSHVTHTVRVPHGHARHVQTQEHIDFIWSMLPMMLFSELKNC